MRYEKFSVIDNYVLCPEWMSVFGEKMWSVKDKMRDWRGEERKKKKREKKTCERERVTCGNFLPFSNET